MASKPYIFRSEEELIEKLRSNATFEMAEKLFSESINTIDEVVTKAINGYTYRSFPGLPDKNPAELFRTWAIRHIKSTNDEICNITNPETYEKYVHMSTINLCEYWDKVRGFSSEMGYGRGSKLFNLVLKKLACFQKLTDTQKRILISLQHVPLDRFTIVGLKNIRLELKIPKNASMGYIKTHKQYLAFHKAITDLTDKAGVPAIYYDILAFDLSHADESVVNEKNTSKTEVNKTSKVNNVTTKYFAEISLEDIQYAMDECDRLRASAPGDDKLAPFRLQINKSFRPSKNSLLYLGSRGPYEARPLLAAAYAHHFSGDALRPSDFTGTNGHVFLEKIFGFEIRSST
ncbi:hypothetical protein I6L39_10720 [Aeromonas sp. FDAARGOS 1409]|uniref:hypothetical protein n=1 Tax=Aeromonas TaxID=642 RepID=UPI001C2183A3|nr:hypothetical protein [Aeromonas sp. FDAARGOS 1409]QXC28449.1 hypothetical protein I6L39_10720 [Aeromonas sp. FDAARGOS 1409]